MTIERIERITVSKMIHLYCKRIHKTSGLCEQCLGLERYAMSRLDRCPYLPDKPVCSNCKTHCYQEAYRTEIKAVMAFSGPRMLFVRPDLAMFHLMRKLMGKGKDVHGSK